MWKVAEIFCFIILACDAIIFILELVMIKICSVPVVNFAKAND